MALTDAQWERIAPLMPTPRGNCHYPARQVLNGWLFIAREGCSWRSLPERYGPWFTVYMRGRRWIDKGVLERVFQELRRAELEARDAEAQQPARAYLDSTIMKVHQYAAGAPRKKGRQSIGRSRGGLTTKLHVIVRDDRLPLDMALSPGQAGDAPWGRTLIERQGRQVGQPQLVADRAYEGRATRHCAAAHGWELVAPPHPNRHAARQRPLDRVAYRARNLVERFFCRLKRFRGVHVRYHKLDTVYLGIIHLACLHIMTR